MNRQPAPWLLTTTVPRWASTSPRTMASPRPAPASGSGVRAPVPRHPTSKTDSRSPGSMPPHASVTESSTISPARRPSTSTTPSAGVCRMAFITRLPTTRERAAGSARTSTSGPISPLTSTRRERATGSAPASDSLTTSRRTVGCSVRLSDPAWILDSSNRSSTIRAIRSTSRSICRW